MPGKPYTPEEDAFIEKHYRFNASGGPKLLPGDGMPVKEIGAHLGRTKSSVSGRANRLRYYVKRQGLMTFIEELNWSLNKTPFGEAIRYKRNYDPTQRRAECDTAIQFLKERAVKSLPSGTKYEISVDSRHWIRLQYMGWAATKEMQSKPAITPDVLRFDAPTGSYFGGRFIA